MEWVRLGDIAEVTSGKNAPKENEFNLEGHPFIRAGHLDSLIEGLNENKLPLISNDTAKKKKYKLYDPTTIIFAKSGMSILKDRVYTLKNPSYIVNHLAAIELKNNNINNDFIKYQLRYIKPSSLIKGESYPSISLSDIKNLKLFLPTIEKQNKIVNTLNELKKIIEIRKEQIQAYDNLIERLFNNIMTFENEVILKKLIEVNPSKSEVKKLEDNLLVSFVPMEDVSETGKLSLNHEKKIKDVYKGFTYFRDNDVVVAKITPCFENGKGALMKGLKNGIGFGTTEFHVLRINDLKKVNPIWLFYLTKSKRFRLYGELQMTGSAGQKRISKSFIENFKSNLPPIELQNKFADHVIKIEEEKKKLNSSLAELESLFNALMQDAFSGNLFED